MFLKSDEDPEAKWMHYMRNGMFEKAWQVSDKVLAQRIGQAQHHLPRHQQGIWIGASLIDKRVLIRCYHGLGDTIQFIRYAPMVKAIAKEVIVWAQPELIPLLKSVTGINKLLPLHDGELEAEYDVDVEVMELPFIFRTSVGNIPAKIPYLYTPVNAMCDKSRMAVGLVWKAGGWDERRDVPFEHLMPLFDIPGIDLYILQYNPRAAGWREGYGIYPGSFELSTYAAMVAGLDLVISVDSMPVHLAGALGVPVWTMLQADADWRWMRHRNDSPWYPTMRLVRQDEQGVWQPVVNRIARALERMANYGAGSIRKAS
jgi:hypothetical protein